MAEPWIEAIGLVAGVLGIVAWVPQIREVWVHKRHEGISLPTFLVVTVALSLWLVYGVLVESIAMIFSNVFTLGVILAVTVSTAWARIYLGAHYPSDCMFSIPQSFLIMGVSISIFYLEKISCGSCVRIVEPLDHAEYDHKPVHTRSYSSGELPSGAAF